MSGQNLQLWEIKAEVQRLVKRNQPALSGVLTQGAVRPGPVLVAGAGAALGIVGPVSGALVGAHGLGQLTAGPAPAGLTVALAVDTHTVGRAAGVDAVH